MNGIIVDGKVYEAVETGNEFMTCSKCDLKMTCDNHDLLESCRILFGDDTDLRLTDKLNK